VIWSATLAEMPWRLLHHVAAILTLRACHPYRTSSVAVVPIIGGGPTYLAWMLEPMRLDLTEVTAILTVQRAGGQRLSATAPTRGSSARARSMRS
jgi:hypothetical protein